MGSAELANVVATSVRRAVDAVPLTIKGTPLFRLHYHLLADIANRGTLTGLLPQLRSLPAIAAIDVHAMEQRRLLVGSEYELLIDSCRCRRLVWCEAFLTKPLFHRLLPETVDAVLILDMDLFFFSDLLQLWHQFDNFGPDAIMGMALETQPAAYHPPDSAVPVTWHGTLDEFPGFNGGVQLLNLTRMRASLEYRAGLAPTYFKTAIDREIFGVDRGTLVHEISDGADQDVYNLVRIKYPHLFYTLPCGWNVQACWWHVIAVARSGQLSLAEAARYFECRTDKIHICHENGKKRCGTCDDVLAGRVPWSSWAYRFDIAMEGMWRRYQRWRGGA